MTDLSRILDGLFEGLGDETTPIVPTFPTSLPTRNFSQDIDIVNYSHTSRNSHTQNGKPEQNYADDQGIENSRPTGVACTSSYVEDVGSVGSQAETPAKSTSLLFPQEKEKVGSVGRGTVGELTLLDPNRAGPQRGDWWNEAHLSALAPQLAPPLPYGGPLPISPADVRAGVDRELQALAARGRTGPDALRDAIDITRAKIRNAPALAPRQLNTGRCHVCEEPLDDTLPVVAVLTGQIGSPLFLHAGCHGEHSRRVAHLVDRIMAAAGLGADKEVQRR